MDASAGSSPPHPVGDADGRREDKAVAAAGEEEELPRCCRCIMEWWVRRIRENISAEDLRGIRLRRSTIEAATARLGGGRQGTMQLLNLILIWVQQNNHHHLQRKRPRHVMEEEEAAGLHGQLSSSPGANPGPGCEFPAGGHDMAAGGGTSLMPCQELFTPPADGGEAAAYPSAAGQCHLFHQSPSKSSVVVNGQPLSPGFGGQYDAGAASHPSMAAQRLAGVEASATKEARPTPKKQQVPPSLAAGAPAKLASGPQQAAHDDSAQRLAASDKLQGANADENLRFLLRKELKRSDVGDLGRIVLPKMVAEVHLPQLKNNKKNHGISIPMEDIGTSRVWNMQYSGTKTWQ